MRYRSSGVGGVALAGAGHHARGQASKIIKVQMRGKHPIFIPSARLRMSVGRGGGLGDLVGFGDGAGFALGDDVARVRGAACSAVALWTIA